MFTGMNMAKSLAHIAERKAFEKILDSIIKKSQTENVSDVFLSLVDKIEKIMGEDWEASSYEMLRQIANDPNSKWAHYVERILHEVDPHILKTFLLNAGFEAGFMGYKTSNKMKFLANAFEFEHISLEEYGVALGLAFLVIPVVEIIKFVQRKCSR